MPKSIREPSNRSRHMRVWRYVDETVRAGSIRRAATRLNITPSALQRRIQDVEEDLGATIFERRTTGIILTTAGEALVRWIRAQAADHDRVRQQIDDLSGLRRGRVRIVCSQALSQSLLPREIAAFTEKHPRVRFDVLVRDHGQGLAALRDYEADLAVMFRPARHPDLQPLMTLGQRVVAIMARDHPLASRKRLRFRDCAAYPLALPDQSFSTRKMIDDLVAAGSVEPVIEFEGNSFELLRNYVRFRPAITFQIEIGADPAMLEAGLAVRPIDDRDQLHGALVLAQLSGRTLPVAAARFADDLAKAMDASRTMPAP